MVDRGGRGGLSGLSEFLPDFSPDFNKTLWKISLYFFEDLSAFPIHMSMHSDIVESHQRHNLIRKKAPIDVSSW